ncbi:putative sulfate exporter family transporter [Pseudomaricurvus alcaniphilus]|uniref:YeiH family protein n=1 Tax=Pseudomaricurvus alcaniphilus TaxID=1166482 RepID=UPI001409FF35|nr:putative sulfate exporter family transporter [Pseudomaricurvus alcaniphilus]NHN37074.1 putative sulfate exporter family transporter [Pseudomaricurvus alcaniphilus]
MLVASWSSVHTKSRVLLPGIIASAVVAAAASFLSEHYDVPVMLFALLLGMAMNFLALEGPCKVGIEFTARTVLRIGVALLGLRITFDQIAALGWQPVLMVVATVTVTIMVSMLLARALGFQSLFGLLTGGATAICGASAAMALSAALPGHPGKEKATLFAVVGVSALSTIAMITYPMVVHWLGLDPIDAGVFLGGTIHDVAQVVGAGYSISVEAGDTATIVKLMRVAMLLPVIVCAAMIARARGTEEGGERPPLLPWFALLFVVMAAVNSTGWVPVAVQSLGNDLSRWCLVIAISALGMKTQLKELASVGFKPILLMVIETVILAAMVLLVIRFF